VQGDLTPACAAALSVVLDALAGKAGPEDTRTVLQRRHDAWRRRASSPFGHSVLLSLR
jgi:hypothetical protein